LAVFLALFFFFAVFFLAALRFFAIECYLLSGQNPTRSLHALSKKIFAQQRRKPPSRDRLCCRRMMFRGRVRGSRHVVAPITRNFVRAAPMNGPPPSAATLDHGSHLQARATSWHLVRSPSSSSTKISIGGLAERAPPRKHRKTREKPLISRGARERERAKPPANRWSPFPFAGDDERCRTGAGAANDDRLIGVEVTARRTVNHASMSTSVNRVGAVRLE
jgi:hypothetical protein